jgi:hypothetical protein
MKVQGLKPKVQSREYACDNAMGTLDSGLWTWDSFLC